ncbi:MAG: hypothetical protein WBF42_04090 [Terracidiphilus sp.]
MSPRLTVVDAAREPLKVLKILMEGLAPSARNGIWLVNFKGIPVARSHSAFDLVYLDDEHRVVHAIEITRRGEFTPFKGDPTSALILPETSLIRSKTFTGDRLTVSEVGHPGTEAAPAQAPKRIAPQQPKVVPALGGKTFNVPAAAQAKDLRAPAAAMSSGRLMRSGSLALKRAPETMPTVSAAVAQETHPAAEAKVVPISIANEQPQEVIRARPEIVAQPLPAQLPIEAAATSLVLAGGTAGTMADATMAAEAVYPHPAEEPVAGEAALAPTAATAPLQRVKKRGPGARSRWDVQLLYMLFPDLDPSYRPEFQAPVVNFTKDVMQRESEKQSRKIQILSWFYPDLELDRVHEKQREHRRAPRIHEPGLVGFYFSGGHSQPHPIQNLSVMGFYMVTEERWLPGTVIRVTLQIIDSPGDDPRDTLTVLSRVVNWGEDGGGFEFVMPGFVD